SPSGLMCGVTFRMMPTCWYCGVLMMFPCEEIVDAVMIGTSCPTMIDASWLSDAKIDGRDSTSSLPVVASARNDAEMFDSTTEATSRWGAPVAPAVEMALAGQKSEPPADPIGGPCVTVVVVTPFVVVVVVVPGPGRWFNIEYSTPMSVEFVCVTSQISTLI